MVFINGLSHKRKHMTHDFFPWLVKQLFIQLSKLEAIFGFSGLSVNFRQEFLDSGNNLGDEGFVRTIFRGVLENGLE